MPMKTALSVWIVPLAILPLGAAEISVIPREIAIPLGGSRSLGFGTVPQRDTTVLLEIAARIHTRTLFGSSPLVKVVLNGRVVEAARSRNAIRLVNKPLISPATPTKSVSWFGGNHGWRLIYAPDFESGREVPFYKGDPYALVLDVTDLVNPAAENRLTLTNLAQQIYLDPGEGELIVQRLTVRTSPGTSPMMLPATDVEPVTNTGQPAAGPAEYRGQITPGGGLAITIGQRRWDVASAFSYPNAGLNRLLPSAQADAGGQAGWTVRVQLRDDGGEVLAGGPDYRLHRSVQFTPGKVEVADQLTNVHRDSPLGLLARHEMSLKGLQVPTVRLAGNPDPVVNEYYSPPNPSVHVSLPDQGIGLLCEDDVFRNQARLFCTADASPVAGIRTEMLRLSPGETYTLRWSVYPVAGPDYFDFVNLVRQDWSANFTVDGPWSLFNPDWILSQPIDELRAKFAHLGIRYIISNGSWKAGQGANLRRAFGMGALDDRWADHRSLLREAAARIREAAPDVKILVYYDSQRDSSEDNRERFRDSWWTDARDKQLSTTWNNNKVTYSYVPTLKNSFGRAMLEAVDRYLSETHSDGIYWDEMEGFVYGRPPITYNQFDGHSCLLDPKRYTITREIGLTTLLAESQLLAVIDRVRSEGRPLFGNGPPFTHAVLATGVPRMVETQHNDFWCYEANLGPPMGWTYEMGCAFSGTTRTLQMGLLPMGISLNVEHDISRYLFPFTPIELHHGYLLGEERIIALHDGNYRWPGKRCLVQLRHFNRDGKLIEADSLTLIGAEARTAVKLANEEAIVLVRLPLRFEPEQKTLAANSAWNAEVRQVRYGTDAISLHLRAPQGGVLRIDSGEFPLQDGTVVTVRLGNESQSLEVVNRALCIAVPAGFSGDTIVKQE